MGTLVEVLSVNSGQVIIFENHKVPKETKLFFKLRRTSNVMTEGGRGVRSTGEMLRVPGSFYLGRNSSFCCHGM